VIISRSGSKTVIMPSRTSSDDRHSGAAPETGPPPVSESGTKGVLVLIATPIGNLGDLSPRAVAELGRVDTLACEDTRRTRRLLSHAHIPTPRLLTINQHTEFTGRAGVIDRLSRGERVAVVSDAGMPGISDPGEQLVSAAIDAGFDIQVIPGPSAAITALVISGLPAGRYVFEGFLPRRGSARSSRLAELADEARTIVLYEAPHRLARTLQDLRDRVGDERQTVLVRELTKLHEQVWRGPLVDAIDHVDTTTPRGEYVIVMAGASPEPPLEADLERAVDEALARGLSTKEAAAEVAAATGVSRRRLYALALARKTV